MSRNEIIEEVLSLTSDEKFSIVEEILKSLDIPDAEINQKWEDEVAERLESYRGEHLETVPTEQVLKK
jgi:putative addiction module component (TIGR02574 family)